MVVPGIEGNDNLAIPSLAEGDPVAVVRVFKEGHNHAGERVAVAERVRHAVLSSAVDLRDHQDIVEEKHFSLVLARLFGSYLFGCAPSTQGHMSMDTICAFGLRWLDDPPLRF